MAKDSILVSASNSGYFPLLRDLVSSFYAVGASRQFDFGVLDVGLNDDEKRWLLAQGVIRIVRPEWPLGGLESQPEWYKAMVCRPLLPNYFTEWATIVWSDSDAWMQNQEALTLAMKGVEQDGFSVIPMIDRSYWIQGVAHGAVDSANWQEASIADGFGADVAQKLRHHPLIFGSFLAGNRDAPHWNAWASFLVRALQRKIYFSAEQAALAMMVHTSGLRTHFLPATCHWACHIGAIGMDVTGRKFVEPSVPHHPVSMLTLPAATKNNPVPVRTTDGRMLTRLLRYRQHHEKYPTQVNMHGQNIAVDGVASARFRDHIFASLSANGKVKFLQIGAMDGKAFDPLHKAIRRHLWTGLLVEPMPDMMKKLQANYADIEGLEFAELAIAEVTEKRTMKRVCAAAIDAGRVPLWAAGLSSLAPERTALSGRALTTEQFAAIEREVEEIEVECVTFPELAARHQIGSFDILQVDAEGYDYNILQQIDLSRYRPQTIQIEIVNLPAEEIVAALAQLHSASYSSYVMEDGQDLFAVANHTLVREGLEWF